VKYLQVMISSELRTQALRLLDHLIRKRLIFGGPVFSGPARFLWKNEVVEHDYCSSITFTPFDGSPAMHTLLEQAFRDREKETTLVAYIEAVAALTFIPFTDIPKRTVSSWGDLSKVQPDDATR
jgi:hypothetical protein